MLLSVFTVSYNAVESSCILKTVPTNGLDRELKGRYEFDVKIAYETSNRRKKRQGKIHLEFCALILFCLSIHLYKN